MAGKIGQKVNRESSPRFKEYYHKNFPKLSIQECEEKARFFTKSCNYRNIEYWLKKFPNKSKEECEKLRQEKINSSKFNNPSKIEYWLKNFPNKSKEECEKYWHQHNKETNYLCTEHWQKIYPNKSKEECEEISKQKKKEMIAKLPDYSGINNPMSRANRTEQEIREGSPMCIEFYRKRFPELSEEEIKSKFEEYHHNTNIKVKNAIKDTNIEYYLNQGMNLEEAKKALHDRQATFTLEKCIKKYGKEEGQKRFRKRQEKWIKSLSNHFEEESKNSLKPYFRSYLQESIENKLKEYFPNIENEFYIYDEKCKRGFSYDIKLGNKIIEVQGDYWHANPKLYEENSIIKLKSGKCLAKEIWAKDKLKKSVATKNKYKVYYIWELDYNSNPEKEIQKCIKFLNK